MGEMLLRAAEVAYGEGITALVELAGPAAGLTPAGRGLHRKPEPIR